MGLVDRRPVVCPTLAMGFWVPLQDHRAGEDPLDRADPAEAPLEDPLGTPTTHQGTATRMPPGGGLSTSAGGSSPSSAR